MHYFDTVSKLARVSTSVKVSRRAAACARCETRAGSHSFLPRAARCLFRWICCPSPVNTSATPAHCPGRSVLLLYTTESNTLKNWPGATRSPLAERYRCCKASRRAHLARRRDGDVHNRAKAGDGHEDEVLPQALR